MMEVYVLVPIRKSIVTTFFGAMSLVLAVVCLLLTCLGAPVVGFLVVAFGALGYYLTFGTNKEYEYSYFDGEARFARITNKSRRKKLGVYSMDEVVQIAPAGDRSVTRYENDSATKVKDYSSHQKDALCYDMIVNRDGEYVLVKFEPDDKYLDAVMVKYAQKVIRR